MTIQDDETLRMYLEESLEHLADIESDLLSIEADGANIDEDLVNKVYRAAHSIKGGAGFMGLINIKDLTHEMENILGKIRSHELIPTSDIINVLLDASDTLKLLMNDIINSNEVDISDQVNALRQVLETEHADVPGTVSDPSDGQNEAPASNDQPAEGSKKDIDESRQDGNLVSLSFPDGRPALTIDKESLISMWDESKCIYLVELKIKIDIQEKGKTCKSVINEMEQTGTILCANFTLQSAADLDPSWEPGILNMLFLFASILKPGDINVLFEIEDEQILELKSDMSFYDLKGNLAQAQQNVAPDDRQVEIEPDHSVEIVSTASKKPPKSAYAQSPPPSDLIEAGASNDSNENSGQTLSGQDTNTEPYKGKKQNKIEHETSLRVHVSLLDQLMTLAGELVLSRNQLLQSMASDDQRGGEIAGQRIDLITSELQEAIMLTRMQSIGNVFSKFPRVVRDLAPTLGKQVELTLEGKEVELDKTIIEAIGDPLTHLVRNAVDHGIETPDQRKRIGKNPAGQIFLKAYHEAGQVNIEISDDGKGLDGNKLAAKAVEKGLITEEQAKIMSVREKNNLIFLPGFSTAEQVTDVSGRGVGMDVVKTNLDKLGGIIDIDSEPGKRTTIRIKLPLTLAIIPCQIVITGGERYAIPQVNLEELLRIPADQVRHRIERVGDADVVRLRGNLLPLIRLADVIGAESFYKDPEAGENKVDRRKSIADRRSKKSALFESGSDQTNTEESEPSTDQAKVKRQHQERRYHSASALNIVVVSTGVMKYGLVVEELNDSEEIVVKPLGRDLKKCKGYAGATIMGDGRVALILDVANIAQMAGLTSLEGTARAAELADAEREAIRAGHDRQSLLIFRSAEDEQFAVPLSLVERIEKIKRTDIETVGGKRVMKYRGGSLPLFSTDEVATVKPISDSENLLVIVFMVAGREIGLLAMGPVDAMETRVEIDGSTLRQTGIMGSAIINEVTTQFVDIFEIVNSLNPHWFQEKEIPVDENGESATILFAEDSNFFRNQVKESMVKEGFKVLEAEDGLIAWDLLQENMDHVALVVTDIEMPNMDGFTLTKKIKGNPDFSHLPVIALTTLAGDEDIAKGKAVGIDDYQIKLDRERLMQSIHNFLKAA